MLDFLDFDEKLLRRPADGNPELRNTVMNIIDDVKKRGDEALFDYAARFDGKIESLFISGDEIEKARDSVPDDL